VSLHTCSGVPAAFKKCVAVVKGLLGLPWFRLMWGCEEDSPWDDGLGMEGSAVEAIVELHRAEWWCLSREGHSRLYERV